MSSKYMVRCISNHCSELFYLIIFRHFFYCYTYSFDQAFNSANAVDFLAQQSSSCQGVCGIFHQFVQFLTYAPSHVIGTLNFNHLSPIRNFLNDIAVDTGVTITFNFKYIYTGPVIIFIGIFVY